MACIYQFRMIIADVKMHCQIAGAAEEKIVGQSRGGKIEALRSAGIRQQPQTQKRGDAVIEIVQKLSQCLITKLAASIAECRKLGRKVRCSQIDRASNR